MQKCSTSQMSMMMKTQTLSELEARYAGEIANDVANSLRQTADLLEKISGSDYFSIIAALRWYAERTENDKYLKAYERYVRENVPQLKETSEKSPGTETGTS